MEAFAQVGTWLLNTFAQLWNFFGLAGFLGFGVIGFVVIRKVVNLFKKIIIN